MMVPVDLGRSGTCWLNHSHPFFFDLRIKRTAVLTSPSASSRRSLVCQSNNLQKISCQVPNWMPTHARGTHSSMRLSSYALLQCALLVCALYLPRLHAFGMEGSAIAPRGIRGPCSATRLAATTESPSAVDSKNLRTFDKWEELHGNFVLRPSVEQGPPRALLHFLGGAIVGAAPHVTYRYLLERLAAEGYLIVATPYNLSFDHLSTCDAVLSRFETIAGDLARTYGPLPVVGVGHSCGALLQLLITSLFPDTPRAACALISYNNKPVQEAIPVFEEVIAPFFTFVAARNDTNRRNGGEVIKLGLELAKLGVTGKLPSDELLTKAMKIALFPPMMDTMMQDKDIKVPTALREFYETLIGPPTSALAAAGLAPIVFDLLETLEQIPQLIDEVADGARDFNPTPDEVSAVARRAYRARRTLILRYTEDPLDESEKIEELVQAAGQVIRMKRPMINIDIQRRDLPGGHAAPLLAPPLELATRAEDLFGAAAAKEQLQYLQADLTVQELTKWLEESDL